MTRIRVLALAALLLTPLPARATPANVVVVPANGTARTALTTLPGMRYYLTVDGRFGYDGTGGRLADACSRQPTAGATGVWSPATNLLVDGSPIHCSAPEASNDYWFEAMGTGSAFTFSVTDPTGPADNVGALAVTVVPGLDAECVPVFAESTQAGSTVLVVTAEAHAAVAPLVSRTFVECHIFVGSTELPYLYSEQPGVESGVAHGEYVVPAGQPIRVCLSAWTNGFFTGEPDRYSWPC